MHWIKLRENQLLLLIIALMIALVVRLFLLTVVEGAEWTKAAETISVKSIYASASRGEIFDRYGRLLAGNRPSFTVHFSAGALSSDEINRQALDLMSLFEDNGDAINDNFPLHKAGEDGFYYTYDQGIKEWLTSQDMPANYTALEAFRVIRERNGIGEGLDDFEAQQQLQDMHNVYPPISVRVMKYREELNRDSFLGRYYLDLDLSAEEAFAAIRETFEIDANLSDEDARRIMVIRNELSAQGYMSYLPAVIAKDISPSTIITLEERSLEFTAADVIAEPVRYYPNGKTASHIVGYLGRISESEVDTYVGGGYNPSDLIGRDGIERSMEEILKGTDGSKDVEVNAFGEYVRTIRDESPVKGNDVYLTVDLELQKTAEEALAQALEKIRVAGTFESPYGKYKYARAYPNANVGGVVAIDVASGDVLAMASNPAYDPNLFAMGISSKDWESVQSENPRDPLAPLPLFNVAARTAVQPGSVFKMVTATAALESGLDPNRKLRDGGAVRVGNRTYGCVLWNLYGGNHGYLNLYEALEVSCNYFFFDIAVGRDFYRGTPLGLEEEMNIEKITDFAEQYGLGRPTGIEIPETVVAVPSEERKMSAMKSRLRNVLIGRGEMYFTDEVVADKERLMKEIDIIVSWVEENPSRNTILERLADLGIRKDKIEIVGDLAKFSYFNQAAWTLGDELNISIGQGENAYTPLQIANYMATIGNKGVRNTVSLLHYIEGEGLHQKDEGEALDIRDPSILEDISEGMRRVAHGSRGSGRVFFQNFPVEVMAKTGTAERGGKINPPDEVAYLKTYLKRINSALTWDEVETEMQRLLVEYPDVYRTQNTAARQAVINLSRGKVGIAGIDAYKEDYDNFAWFVAMAPVEDPQIAVAVLIFQGGTGGNAAPVAREVIGKYLELNKEYTDFQLDTIRTQ